MDWPKSLRGRWIRWHRTTRIAIAAGTLWALWTIFQALVIGVPSRPAGWSQPAFVVLVVAAAPLSGLAVFFLAWVLMTPFRQSTIERNHPGDLVKHPPELPEGR